MDDNRVVAVLFTIQLMLEKYMMEYIILNKNGKYTRKKYNLILKDVVTERLVSRKIRI